MNPSENRIKRRRLAVKTRPKNNVKRIFNRFELEKKTEKDTYDARNDGIAL